MSGSMTVLHSNTGYEPNSETDMSGRFVAIVDITHDDDEANSHMSDIPLQLLASAHVFIYQFCLVTFSQAEGDLMRNVPSLHPMPRSDRRKHFASTVSQYIQGSPAVLGLEETVQTGYTTSTRSSE